MGVILCLFGTYFKRKTMKIGFFTIKGSGGKTPHAINYCLEKNTAYATNEPFNIMDQVVPDPDKRYIYVDPEEEFPHFSDDIEIVFDLAGMITHGAKKSIFSAIDQCDVVVVPVFNELKSISHAIRTIIEIEKRNKTVAIIVLATKLEKRGKENKHTPWDECEDFINIKNAIFKTFEKEYPIFPSRASRVFDIIFEKEKSVGQLREATPIDRYTYTDVGEQIETFYNFLENNYAR